MPSGGSYVLSPQVINKPSILNVIALSLRRSLRCHYTPLPAPASPFCKQCLLPLPFHYFSHRLVCWYNAYEGKLARALVIVGGSQG